MSTTTQPTEAAALLDASLEIAAARGGDIVPAVYARFFVLRPDAAELFTVPDPTQPPLGCGQMMFEIINLLMDSAAGKPYVASYMRKIAIDHKDCRVADPVLYTQFMAAFRDVVADLLGADWNETYAAAWERQCAALLRHVQEIAAPGAACLR